MHGNLIQNNFQDKDKYTITYMYMETVIVKEVV